MDSNKIVNGVFGEVIFKDDFSDQSSGWSNKKTEYNDTLIAYPSYTDDEKYSVKLFSSNVSYAHLIPNESKISEKILVEVDAQFKIDITDQIYGLVMKFKDDKNTSLFFEIKNNGKYTIYNRNSEDDWDSNKVVWKSNEKIINTESNTLNKITLVKDKQFYYFYVNNLLLEKIDIGANIEGTPGIYISNREVNNEDATQVEVIFDNFRYLSLPN